jgi:hypothetical protein
MTWPLTELPAQKILPTMCCLHTISNRIENEYNKLWFYPLTALTNRSICRFELPLVLGHHPPYSLLFAGLLCTLVCMHVYWFVLLARIAIMTAVTGRAKDTREDED